MHSRNPRLRVLAVFLIMLSSTLLVAVLAWPVPAGLPLADVSFIASRVYPVGLSPANIAVGDFNGDGKPDLVTVNGGSNDVSVLINKGNGTYFPAVNYAVGTGPVSISVGDFNGDGKTDIAVLNRASSTVSILLGNGDGTFPTQKVTTISTGNMPDSLAAGDFNGDGKLDIAVTVSLPQIGQRAVAVLLGNGDGTFQAATNYDSGSGAQSAVVGDFNADGKLDIAIADGNNISILLGNGDGTFRSAMNTPATVPVNVIYVADFNHDGKLDVLTTGSSTSPSLFVFLGNGDGSLGAPLVTTTSLPFPPNAAVGDFNGDGFPDVVAFEDDGLTVYLAKGDGTFQELAPFVMAPSHPTGAVALDLNGDGITDLAVADGVLDRVYVAFGKGDGTFEVAKIVPVAASTAGAQSALTADMNGDGKLDLVFTTQAADVGIALGNGDGSFKTPPFTTPVGGRQQSARSMVISDLNLDGKPDLVILPPGDLALNVIGVLIGNGDGTLQPVTYYATNQPPTSVGVGDFNLDGKPDVIGADDQGNLYLLLGNGDGTFGFATTIPIANPNPNVATALAVGDFNHDGKLDVALAGQISGMSTGEASILLGNGDGTFQPSMNLALPGVPSNVAVGDFNRDGNLDVVLTIPASNAVAVLLGNGNGTFNAAVSYPAGLTTNSVVVGDMNNDGILDLVTASGADVSILLGNGDGSFQPPESFGPNGFAETAAIGDLNGDGAPDLAVAGREVSILTQLLARPVPAANIAPSLVSFGNQSIGFTSAAHSVTLTNGGTAALNLASVSLTGPQGGDFSQTNTCGTNLAAGGSCTFSITFAPSALGIRIASIVIADNAFNSPQVISLSGRGMTGPGAGLAPAALTFAGGLIGTASTQITTLTNTGNAPLTISNFAISGANSGDFAQTNTCPASSTNLAVGASCTISVTFTPSVAGNRTASVSITDDASGSPQSIPLTGVGTDFSLDVASGSNCPAGGNCSTAAVVTTGQTAAYNLQVSPVSGFNGNVALTCSGAPTPSTCAIPPALVPPNGSSSYAFTVTINNTSSVMTLPLTTRPNAPQWPTVRFVSPLFMIFGMMVMLAGLVVAQTRRQRVPMPAFAVLLLGFLCACGCGGGGSGTTVRPPTSATITVTGTSGGVSRTLHLSLTVNH